MTDAARLTPCLTLARVETVARLLGRPEDAGVVERRLDAVTRGALPHALAEAMADRLGGADEVVRIDRIDIDVEIERAALDTGELTTRWAARLGAALAARLAAPGGRGVARFASHAALAAAYLEHRFGVATHPAFAFAEFAALEHVTPDAAAAELIGVRATILPALARLGARRGQPLWLARRWAEASAAATLERMAAGEAIARPGLAAIRALINSGPPDWRALPPARGALALALAWFARAGADADEPPAATLAHARLASLASRIALEAPKVFEQLTVARAAGSLDLAALPLPLGRAVAAALAAYGSVAHGEQALVSAAQALTGRPRPTARSPSLSPAARRPIAMGPSLPSQFAGFALALPMLRVLDAELRLAPDQLRATVVAALAPPPEPELVPAAASLAEFLIPPVAARLLAPWPALPGERLPTTADLLALHLLGRFAARLPGLEASSPAYLRRQFLHIGGELTLEEDAVHVRLAPVPLGIVLTMAGMAGEQGAVPWLAGRRLRIALA